MSAAPPVGPPTPEQGGRGGRGTALPGRNKWLGSPVKRGRFTLPGLPPLMDAARPAAVAPRVAEAETSFADNMRLLCSKLEEDPFDPGIRKILHNLCQDAPLSGFNEEYTDSAVAIITLLLDPNLPRNILIGLSSVLVRIVRSFSVQLKESVESEHSKALFKCAIDLSSASASSMGDGVDPEVAKKRVRAAGEKYLYCACKLLDFNDAKKLIKERIEATLDRRGQYGVLRALFIMADAYSNNVTPEKITFFVDSALPFLSTSHPKIQETAGDTVSWMLELFKPKIQVMHGAAILKATTPLVESEFERVLQEGIWCVKQLFDVAPCSCASLASDAVKILLPTISGGFPSTIAMGLRALASVAKRAPSAVLDHYDEVASAIHYMLSALFSETPEAKAMREVHVETLLDASRLIICFAGKDTSYDLCSWIVRRLLRPGVLNSPLWTDHVAPAFFRFVGAVPRVMKNRLSIEEAEQLLDQLIQILVSEAQATSALERIGGLVNIFNKAFKHNHSLFYRYSASLFQVLVAIMYDDPERLPSIVIDATRRLILRTVEQKELLLEEKKVEKNGENDKHEEKTLKKDNTKHEITSEDIRVPDDVFDALNAVLSKARHVETRAQTIDALGALLSGDQSISKKKIKEVVILALDVLSGLVRAEENPDHPRAAALLSHIAGGLIAPLFCRLGAKFVPMYEKYFASSVSEWEEAKWSSFGSVVVLEARTLYAKDVSAEILKKQLMRIESPEDMESAEQRALFHLMLMLLSHKVPEILPLTSRLLDFTCNFVEKSGTRTLRGAARRAFEYAVLALGEGIQTGVSDLDETKIWDVYLQHLPAVYKSRADVVAAFGFLARCVKDADPDSGDLVTRQVETLAALVANPGLRKHLRQPGAEETFIALRHFYDEDPNWLMDRLKALGSKALTADVLRRIKGTSEGLLE